MLHQRTVKIMQKRSAFIDGSVLHTIPFYSLFGKVVKGKLFIFCKISFQSIPKLDTQHRNSQN